MIDLSQLPPISAIYRVWHQNQIIYVGQAINLKKRWETHHILPKLLQKYGTDWTMDWVKIAPSNLNRAEAFAYRSFKPELNQKNPSELLGLDSTNGCVAKMVGCGGSIFSSSAQNDN